MGQGWICAGPCRLTGAALRCWVGHGAFVHSRMPASKGALSSGLMMWCSLTRCHQLPLHELCGDLQQLPYVHYHQIGMMGSKRHSNNVHRAGSEISWQPRRPDVEQGHMRTSAANADCRPDFLPGSPIPLRGDACSEREATWAACSRSSCWHRSHM